MGIYQRGKHFFEKYERHISSVALIGGFIIDNLTLTRVDYWLDHAFILIHLVILSVGILMLNAIEMKEVRGKYSGFFHAVLPTVMQFSFGALFSAFSVLYTRSASFTTGGIFLIILFGLLIGNEFLKEKYRILAFQVALLSLVTYLYLIFLIPLGLSRVGDLIFILSGVATLVSVWLYVLLLRKVAPARFHKSKYMMYAGILAVFVVVNGSYFLNLIPPIPLALKSSGVYHSVIHNGDAYVVQTETYPWYSHIDPYDDITIRHGEPIFVFTSIYSPSKFALNVVHSWEYFDNESRRWKPVSQVAFNAVGGRADGYRGYSEKENVFPGLWRVSVKTSGGRVIGRVLFNIIEASTTPELHEETL
jgi:F0F1-type ATP synthase assembly protein I